MAPSRYRKVLLALRVCAGVFAIVGGGIYVAILCKVTNSLFQTAQEAYITTFPMIGAALCAIWDIIALVKTWKVSTTRPLWYAVGDLTAAAILATLGTIGFVHDTVTYLQDATYLVTDNGPWLVQEIVAGCFLLASFFTRLLLVLFNVLKRRQLIQAGRVPQAAPAYMYGNGPYENEKEQDVEVDWKSVVSADSIVSESKTPETVKV